MSAINIGEPAPNFSLVDQNDQLINLQDLRGQPVIVYFYPKAMTPGCTVQACGIRDSHRELAKLNIRTLAISPDMPVRLKKFEDKHDLNFTLLSDPDNSVAKAYDVWQLKKFMGKEYMGIVRTSFIVDANGILVAKTAKVNTKTHHVDIVEQYQQLNQQINQ